MSFGTGPLLDRDAGRGMEVRLGMTKSDATGAQSLEEILAQIKKSVAGEAGAAPPRGGGGGGGGGGGRARPRGGVGPGGGGACAGRRAAPGRAMTTMPSGWLHMTRAKGRRRPIQPSSPRLAAEPRTPSGFCASRPARRRKTARPRRRRPRREQQ